MQLLNDAGLGVEFWEYAQDLLDHLRERQPASQVPMLNRSMFGLSSSPTSYAKEVSVARRRMMRARAGMMQWNTRSVQADVTQAYLSASVNQEEPSEGESDISTGSEVDDTMRAAVPRSSWPQRR